MQEHRCVLLHVGGVEPEQVLPDGEQEIAELLGVSPADLAPMQYGFEPGQERMMYMRRADQLDRTVPINQPASHGLALAGVAVLVRGPALLVVGGVPWLDRMRKAN